MTTKLKDLEKVGRQAFLATIGTYAKGWDILSGQASKAFDDTNHYINGLIKDGEKIESDLKAKLNYDELLDDKVQQLKIRLGVETRYEDKIAVLSKQVESLTAEVEKLVAIKAAEKPAPVKKAPARKAPTKKAAPAKKPVAKPATVAKAETTKKPAVRKPRPAKTTTAKTSTPSTAKAE